MPIPRTYHDGNPEDRNAAADFWAWLREQPQAAWLYYARVANRDDGEGIFMEMVAHPSCDRALASWLFWKSGPAHFLAQGERPGPDSLLGAILSRSDAGGFARGTLHYGREEVALEAFAATSALEGREGAPFAIPRDLCAAFDGRNPDLPSYDDETERDLADIFRHLDGWLPRSDAEVAERERRGGNRWYVAALRLPERPEVQLGMSDVAAIDAVFGEHRASLDRIEQARLAARGQRSSDPLPLVNPDPVQRMVGLALVALSAAALYFLLG
ncbi:DUF4274 domain-containing protein [Sphingomonas astaxanthinifaciens]|uniref:DUF4274 domain-containing protein n=1 Tax=Sphingomonas astaxanthinifaciens DSM 22298 TaxID=1123267 RepID=A0ABQ5Z854_9SPHN|nr:DUF4274 domain-containing protein [Sphingomonas astaxanthinifaciens]GLR47727.1 hypothetical protein GCM10007925_14400 [Sphingomonas astaxanthinifaciens DSM 22298]